MRFIYFKESEITDEEFEAAKHFGVSLQRQDIPETPFIGPGYIEQTSVTVNGIVTDNVLLALNMIYFCHVGSFMDGQFFIIWSRD